MGHILQPNLMMKVPKKFGVLERKNWIETQFRVH